MINKELAVLFKKIIHPNDEIEFIPISVKEGHYNNEDNSFIDKDGTPYYHIIENPDSYGYCHRDSIISYKNDYRHLPLGLMKTLILREIKKYNYTYNLDRETSAPIILFNPNSSSEQINILLDNDITNFYEEKCPEFYNMFINQSENKEEIVETPEISFQKVYEELTSCVIDQEEAIQKLLTLIWKQKEGNRITNKNIIIDGPSGVGKSKIAKKITEILNIPSVTISASGGKFPSADYLILELLKKTKLDIESAQKGIIIIDKFEELIKYISPEGEAELEKILNKDTIMLTTNAGEYTFETSNLIVIGLSNLDRINKTNKQTIGFDNQTTKNTDSHILESFSSPIKMKKLDYNSFIKILKSQNGLLNSNIEYLYSKGVELKIETPAIEKIARIAVTNNHGVKSLDEIIERTLEVAEFEIASNPNLYSKLIITSETPDNNKAYTLVRKK